MNRDQRRKLGATGKFPRGKLNASDEGQITMGLAVDHHGGVVRLEFGKPVAWLGLPAREARELGELLIAKAAELEARQQ